MSIFGPSYTKRVTKDEFADIMHQVYGKLDEAERVELEKFFRADLYEAGTEAGISQSEFDSGMLWLKANMKKHEFESDDLAIIEKYFTENLQD